MGVGDVSGEAVEFGDGQDAAGPQRGEGLIQAGAVGAAGAGEAPVDVDALGRDAQRGELFYLDVEVLLVCRAARTRPGCRSRRLLFRIRGGHRNRTWNTLTEQSDQPRRMIALVFR